MKKLWLAVGLVGMLHGAAPASDIEDILKEKGVIDSVEANEVKAGKEKAQAPALPPLPDWLNKVTLSGDMRVRNETFLRKDDPDRVRQRFRLRFGAKVKVNDETELGLRLASGSANDPISNNQTFTDTFTFKSINISNAYAKLAPAASLGLERPWVTLMGGKFDVPTYTTTNLMFDRDLTPEGFFESVKPVEMSDGILRGLALNLGQWIFQENSRTGEGAIYAFQGLANLSPARGVFANVGVGDYMYNKPSTIAVARNKNTELAITNNVLLSDGTVVGGKRVDPTKFGPNKDGLDANGKPIKISGFVSDFNVVDAGSDIQIATGLPAWPLKIFGDYILNTEATGSDDTGFQAGIGIGNSKDPRDFNFTYAYQRLETDATVSAFSDSDFGRDGGTNTEGHILQVTYVLLKNLSFVSTAWITEPIDDVSGRNPERDYRWQVDMIAKF
jgi:hypothetical protein